MMMVIILTLICFDDNNDCFDDSDAYICDNKDCFDYANDCVDDEDDFIMMIF